VCSAGAAAVLRRVLDEQEALLPEWLSLAAARGLRAPPAVLPRLLEAGRRSIALRADLARVAGRRGVWLAAQNTAWSYLLAEGGAALDETDWLEGPLTARLALSAGSEAMAAAGWLEGFLAGGGMVLLHDDRLWSVLDDWVAALGGDAFVRVLPLVRRTFSQLPSPERQQMGRRVKAGHRAAAPRRAPGHEPDLDVERAAKVLPTVRRFLGLGGPA